MFAGTTLLMRHDQFGHQCYPRHFNKLSLFNKSGFLNKHFRMGLSMNIVPRALAKKNRVSTSVMTIDDVDYNRYRSLTAQKFGRPIYWIWITGKCHLCNFEFFHQMLRMPIYLSNFHHFSVHRIVKSNFIERLQIWNTVLALLIVRPKKCVIPKENRYNITFSFGLTNFLGATINRGTTVFCISFGYA